MKVITSLTVDGTVYELGKEVDGRLVKSIDYRRDGIAKINLRCENESHYLVTLDNVMTEKETVFKVLPACDMDELTYIEVEENSDDDGKVDMKRI